VKPVLLTVLLALLVVLCLVNDAPVVPSR